MWSYSISFLYKYTQSLPWVLSHLRNWFKGNDTRTVLRFIEWRFGRALADYDGLDEPYLEAVFDAGVHANACMRHLYGNGLWLSPFMAATISDHGLAFLRGFSRVATIAYGRSTPRFLIVPNVHMFAHIMHDIRLEGLTGHPVMNPLAYSCQLDEDYVGRVCALARTCHAKTLHYRTLQKVKVAMAVKWGC